MSLDERAPAQALDPKDEAMIERLGKDEGLRQQANSVFLKTCEYRYSYNFTWLGRPIIQYPEDIVATQEIIWKTRPDLIVETGIAHGGSLIFFASLLEMLGGDRRVLGVDIDIRDHNRREIETHSMSRRIDMIQGSSVDPEVIQRVHAHAEGRTNVLVVLDSNHTEEHVLLELEAYSSLVRRGGYLLVFDTAIENMPASWFNDRPWDVGNNPMTAIQKFLAQNKRFEIDLEYTNKLLLSVAPNGYLRCIEEPR